MSVEQEIRSRLEEVFHPEALEVIDESEAHRGHSGYQEGGESHFKVVIAAPAFASMSRLARHRAVHGAIGPELIGRIHALELNITG